MDEQCMECLYCGDCCLRMSPISNPCPYIHEEMTFVFCSIYDGRPESCKAHRHPFRFCPVGIDKLQITDATSIAIRIDAGWDLIKILNTTPPLAERR